jgi:hypothetical protein
MTRLLGAALLLAACGLATVGVRGADDAPAKKDAKDKEAKDEPSYNSPPKGALLVSLGTVTGRITKGCDGKAFSMEISKGKEVEVNLAKITTVYVINGMEFDDKGNPKKTAARPVKGAPDDIRAEATAVVELSGTRNGKWLMAKRVTVKRE